MFFIFRKAPFPLAFLASPIFRISNSHGTANPRYSPVLNGILRLCFEISLTFNGKKMA